MEKPEINSGAAPEKPVAAKLQYVCPSVVELDMASTESGIGSPDDGIGDNTFSRPG